MGQHRVTRRPRQVVASATFLSPFFITKEKCQLLTARDDTDMQNLSIPAQEK